MIIGKTFSVMRSIIATELFEKEFMIFAPEMHFSLDKLFKMIILEALCCRSRDSLTSREE